MSNSNLELYETLWRIVFPPPMMGMHEDGEKDGGQNRWQEGESELELRQRPKRAKRYQVILHNDDYTSMEFVIKILQDHFHKNATQAHHLMLQVHHKGRATAGVYGKDEAETKVQNVTEEARAHEMPLKCTMEPQ